MTIGDHILTVACVMLGNTIWYMVLRMPQKYMGD